MRRDEVVREKPGSEGDPSRWRFDHDYIARAIIAESRYANRLMQQIEDGNTAWNAAGSNLAQRYRSLLPLTAQAKLLWARLWPKSGFRYAPYRSYASLSLLRALPIVAIFVAGGWVWREESIRASMTQIVEGLNSDQKLGAAAVLSLWGASPVVRDAVVDHLLDSPARLRAVGTDWVHAYTSIESVAALSVADRLREARQAGLDPDTRRYLIYAYGSAAARLDAADAAKAASDLRDRLAKPALTRIHDDL